MGPDDALEVVPAAFADAAAADRWAAAGADCAGVTAAGMGTDWAEADPSEDPHNTAAMAARGNTLIIVSNHLNR